LDDCNKYGVMQTSKVSTSKRGGYKNV